MDIIFFSDENFPLKKTQVLNSRLSPENKSGEKKTNAVQFHSCNIYIKKKNLINNKINEQTKHIDTKNRVVVTRGEGGVMSAKGIN